MRGKPIRNKNKILVALVALFTMLMCTSIGFATWVTAGGSSTTANGNLEADDYVEITSGEAYCISNLSINGFRYAASYGLVDETAGVYANSIDITGTYTFQVGEAKTAISSLNSTNKRFSLTITITASITTDFSFNNFSFTGYTNGTTAKTTTSLSATHNVVLSTSEYNQTSLSNLGFSFKMNYTGSSLPDLSSASYSVTIQPGEYIA